MKRTEYVLNGKLVDKATITRRKAKLSQEITTTVKYYTAELTAEEEAEKKKQAIAASNFFRRQSEYREDQELLHG